MTALAIGAGAAVLGTAFQVEQGLSQEHKANELKKSLKDPVYRIPPEFEQNRNIARQMAQRGLPQAVINQQTDQNNQNQAGAIQAVSRSANPGAGVASIVRQGDQAQEKLAAEDAQARDNNQRYFISQNSQMAGQEIAKQQSDVFDKYTRNFNQMQADRGAGLQNLNTAGQDTASLGGTALQYAYNPTTAAPQTFAQKNGVAPISAQEPYTPPPLTTNLPTQQGFGNNMKFNPVYGFNPNGDLVQPQYNNPYFANQ